MFRSICKRSVTGKTGEGDKTSGVKVKADTEADSNAKIDEFEHDKGRSWYRRRNGRQINVEGRYQKVRQGVSLGGQQEILVSDDIP